MDNRGYDPDKAHKEHLEPADAPASDASPTLGPNYEQPVPIDPQQGMVANPSETHINAPQSSWDVQRPAYGSEYERRALENQPPQAHDQPTGPPPPDGIVGMPPSQSPYAPGPGMAPGGYPPPPSDGERRGFNWLLCCGIGCGVALLGLGLIAYFSYGFFSRVMDAGKEMGRVAETVTATDPATAESQALQLHAADVSANIELYTGQWLLVDGVLSDLTSTDPGMGGAFGGNRSLQDATSYFVAPNLIVLDISGAARVGQTGDAVRVLGQPASFDFAEILGEGMAKQLQQEEGFSTLVFVVANRVELLAEGAEITQPLGSNLSGDEEDDAERARSGTEALDPLESPAVQ